jgi:hypothetical protein
VMQLSSPIKCSLPDKHGCPNPTLSRGRNDCQLAHVLSTGRISACPQVLHPHIVRIQALIRGFLQRRRTVELKVRTAAAVRIQAFVRGCIQRREYKKRLWKMQRERWARQESEALRAQVYQMQLWMHQMATSIAYSAAAPGAPLGYPGQSA